uniref:Uncharacterized protein n=1 Tax=Arundo donax TaxID=35708 RepID=A0A0A9F388_ARUDO
MERCILPILQKQKVQLYLRSIQRQIP